MFAVAEASIRLRILKHVDAGELWTKATVAEASIRLRILKLRTSAYSQEASSRGIDPFEDTESYVQADIDMTRSRGIDPFEDTETWTNSLTTIFPIA